MLANSLKMNKLNVNLTYIKMNSISPSLGKEKNIRNIRAEIYEI